MELFFRSELAMRMPAATGKPSSGASIAFPWTRCNWRVDDLTLLYIHIGEPNVLNQIPVMLLWKEYIRECLVWIDLITWLLLPKEQMIARFIGICRHIVFIKIDDGLETVSFRHAT
jgi:hypothetical protein